MIRITDEPIYSMSRLEYMELMREYGEYLKEFHYPSEYTFEQWLMLIKKRGYTTHQQENP